MRGPSRPKIRIFDLEELRNVESKNILSKSWRNNKNLKLLIAKFFHLMILRKEISITFWHWVLLAYFYSLHASIKLIRIIKWKNFAVKFFRFWLFLQLLRQNLIDSTSLNLSRSKILFFRQKSSSGLLIWFSLLHYIYLKLFYIWKNWRYGF